MGVEEKGGERVVSWLLGEDGCSVDLLDWFERGSDRPVARIYAHEHAIMPAFERTLK